MAAKKVISRRKTNYCIDDETSQQSQQSESSQRSRAKKYSKDETDMLTKICLDYDAILGKNSSSDVDKRIKDNAWVKIKRLFDDRCRSEGIYVSIST